MLRWRFSKYCIKRLWRSTVWNALLFYECFRHQKAAPQRSTTSSPSTDVPQVQIVHTLQGLLYSWNWMAPNCQGYERIMEEVHTLTCAQWLQSHVAHPSKTCCLTINLAGKVYTAARPWYKFTRSGSSESWTRLAWTLSYFLSLTASNKMIAYSIGYAMGRSLAVLNYLLWLNLMWIKDSETPHPPRLTIRQFFLFGNAVEGWKELGWLFTWFNHGPHPSPKHKDTSLFSV